MRPTRRNRGAIVVLAGFTLLAAIGLAVVAIDLGHHLRRELGRDERRAGFRHARLFHHPVADLAAARRAA